MSGGVYPRRAKSYVQEWIAVLRNLESSLSAHQVKRIKEHEILRVLYIKYSNREDFETYNDMFFIEPNFEELFDEFKEYDFSYNKIELEVELPEFDGNDLVKAQVKSGNNTWVVHLYDKDPFPSKPHAHNLDNNLKLNLKTGQLYHKFKNVGKISKKELEHVRTQFTAKGIAMPS